MPQLDVICDLNISFNVDNSQANWTLAIKIVLASLVESDLAGPGTSSNGNFISSYFRAYLEHPNPILYTSYTSI
jgi:hypothetical protein